MIKSMTGYGSAKGETEGLELSIELKSVNNRYLDTSVRIPRSFIFAEETLKSVVHGHISRGKVDVFVSINSEKADNAVITVNHAVVEGYLAALREISDRHGVVSGVDALSIAKLPEVLSLEKREADREVITGALCGVLEAALAEYDRMRLAEGAKLKDDLLARADEIDRLTDFVEERSPQTVADYRSRLEARMREVLESTTIEEARILTEAAIFADKVAVNEEIVRLRSHLAQLRALIDEGSPVGRKLDFLTQEMNREANTIGSKANDTEISKCVVDMKAALEKVREQVQNIE